MEPEEAFMMHTGYRLRGYIPKAQSPTWRLEYRERLWRGAKGRAKSLGIAFSIKPSDIEIPRRCPVLGLELEPTEKGVKNQESAPSLDRIVPDKGYVPGNVAVISWRANRMKWNSTLPELKALVRWMEQRRRRSVPRPPRTGAQWSPR